MFGSEVIATAHSSMLYWIALADAARKPNFGTGGCFIRDFVIAASELRVGGGTEGPGEIRFAAFRLCCRPVLEINIADEKSNDPLAVVETNIITVELDELEGDHVHKSTRGRSRAVGTTAPQRFLGKDSLDGESKTTREQY